MSKINIRESLNRLDIKTDNKYDLRNTYDCSNISDDKKKELAEALNKNASAKEISKLLREDYDDFDPKYDARYEVDSYYGANYSGLEDDLYTNDFEEVKDWVWEKIQNGGYIEVSDRERGKSVRLDPENYDLESDDAYRVLDDLEELSLLNEDYGGAYDIDPEMFWTKDDLIEFSDAVCDKLTEKFGYQYDIADVGAESNNDMYILIEDTTHGIEADVSFRIKMSRIRSPRDLMKYLDTVVSEFVKKFEEEYQYYDFDESLKESLGLSKKDKDELVSAIEDAKKSNKDYFDINIANNIYVTFGTVGLTLSKITGRTEKVKYLTGWKNKSTDDIIKELSSQDWKIEESLKEDLDEEQLYKIVCKSGASEWPFESALSYEDAEKIVDYYNGRWIDEKGFEWSMEIEEDDESTERVYPFDESLKEGFSEVSGDFAFARKNWDKLGTGVSFDDALEEYNDKYGEEYFYAKPIYVKSAWNKMVSMFAESLKEDYDDETDFEEEELGYFGEVEEGVSFFEDGEEWTWEERIAGPVHIDFDNWSVWKAKNEDSKRVYFVVDEDTGFIDWGPVENQTEAQDFLNGKVSDWEKETNFRHPMHDDLFDESLKESKDIKDNGYEVIIHYDDIGNENNSEYDYKLDRDDFLKGMCTIVEDDEDAPENYDMRLEWVEDNLEELVDKHEIDILDYFQFDAQEDEYNNRENFYEPEYDPFEKD